MKAIIWILTLALAATLWGCWTLIAHFDSRTLSVYSTLPIKRALADGSLGPGKKMELLVKPTIFLPTRDKDHTAWNECLYDDSERKYLMYFCNGKLFAIRYMTYEQSEWLFKDDEKLRKYLQIQCE